MMGSPEDEVGRKPDDGPQHEITLSSFLIGKYEISQEQWESVMDSNPSLFKGRDLPVENICWDDIQKFREETQLVLPTEAQWEYACRAGSTSSYTFGKTISNKDANLKNESK